VTINNRTINPDFVSKGVEGMLELISAKERGEDATGKLDNSAFQQAVDSYARIGIDYDTKEFPNLAKWEAAVRIKAGVESKRAGGKRSLGTGYIMPKTPKTYKHYMREAVLRGVELIDSDGNPREFCDVKDDLKKSKDPKTPEERIMNTLTSYCKLRENCTEGDARVVAADEYLVNWMRDRGYSVTVPAAPVEAVAA
jgi:hypothetical protein